MQAGQHPGEGGNQSLSGQQTHLTGRGGSGHRSVPHHPITPIHKISMFNQSSAIFTEMHTYNLSLWAGHCTVINIKIHTVHETCLEQLSGHNCVIKFAHCLVSFFIAGTIGYLQKYIPIVFQGCLLLE